jgi:uncharacterized protein (DUF934 family)
MTTPVTFYAPEAALPSQALVLDNTADVLAQRDALQGRAAVVLNFPKWTDGRAYSQAALLRGRLGYTGELIASGDVLADMAPLLARCGFSALRLRADQDPATAQRALGLITRPYQQVLPERAHPKARP